MIYHVYTLLLLLLILITLPLWIWRYLRTPKYRDTVIQRLGFGLPALPPGRRIWVHAVSVGETIAAQGLIQQLAIRFPEDQIILSTVTKTGQEIAKTMPALRATFYLPIDLPWIMHRVTRTLHPRCLIVMETELWPGLFYAMARAEIPVILVNGRLSPRSFRQYRKFFHFMKRFLAPVHLFGMQAELDAQRMIGIGAPPERVQVTGNIKYDQAMQQPDPAKMAELAHRLPPPQGLIWIAAGTHPGEEESVLVCFTQLKKTFPDLRLILVPRHPERGTAVATLVEQYGCSCTRFSQVAGCWEEEVLLVDAVGWLTRLYGYAHYAFVGGSLIPHGGQNMLEPASWGLPILFGPHTWNFREITRQLLERDAAIQVARHEELFPAMQALLMDSTGSQQMGARAKEVVASNVGAVERTILAIEQHLAQRSTP